MEIEQYLAELADASEQAAEDAEAAAASREALEVLIRRGVDIASVRVIATEVTANGVRLSSARVHQIQHGR